MTAIATPRLKNQEPISQPLITDQWISATWEEFVQILENPLYADSRCYYDKNQFRQMRIETELVNSAHALDHGMTLFAISLYCTLAAIPARGLINCSYTKTGVQGCQPDISYYIGESASLAPRSNSVVNLDEFAVPNLVIEISSSTLGDDLGKKRLLYEQLGASEYWVVDVQEVKIIAFEMIDGGSRQITESKLLGGLAIADLEFALRLSREKSQSEVGAWLLQKYSDR
ncbi:Uma2 family endonuclease [Pseudanabaena yagii]|uniref:Uma2 family endonuclease n=1 Tax=Pseudanabaena yagii GIHE-NHR1 TaxID=2722753 RepID=A0ABX1LZU1_9CYAN|nr:Uma2 family endonuclease [Pseudanabaena yagii]NMF60936.1 Uma2 family endonuclease [Pseudanabaena yagii GIHE-NHR1]